MQHTLLTLTLALVYSITYSQSLPDFESNQDIGNPKLPGSVRYDPESQVYTVKAAGYNIWFERDEFHYAYRKLKGDFILTADFEFEGAGVDPHRKFGWMVRESLDEKAAHISATNHGDGLVALQWRSLRGAFMRDPQDQILGMKKGCRTIQLERIGATYVMRTAHFGEPLQEIGRIAGDEMPDDVYVGIFVCSHNADVVESAKIRNVRIDQPLPVDYNPYQSGFINSRLEVMDPFTGARRVIRKDEVGMEAPNWLRTGDKFLVNQAGSIMEVPMNGGDPVKLNTGFADRNNNDHVVSFDGKQLGISHHRTGLKGGGSTVYVLPLSGGTPRMVTEETPSYLHGWSPDGKFVTYVANREGEQYNIYKKPVAGGPEVRLTNNEGTFHVDGPEYSPDGKYIYFNSTKSGTMQIWRMKPDGSNPEQLTFDQYNSWFPHISPDGKWIVFISYVDEINPTDHPPFKRVILRMMPAAGGDPRVIAYIYGGQSTINVPSWSPDSKRIAFVSFAGRGF